MLRQAVPDEVRSHGACPRGGSPYDWKNPAHAKIPVYVQGNLSIAQEKKDSVSTLMNTLRLFREHADYRPGEVVDEEDVRNRVRDAAAVQQELWGDVNESDQ